MQSITPDQPFYPHQLLQLHDPPQQLFYEGDISLAARLCIAVVGSRMMSTYAQSCMHDLIRPLVRAGMVIVSGLAYGVDAQAHHLVVKEGGHGIAVVAHGLDQCYPKANEALLADLLLDGGLVLSEYPEGTVPLKRNFLARNRIIAGLAHVLVIIEAGERSGTFATAQAALECGREVAVVPSDITRLENAGGLALLKQGAHPVCTAQDIASLAGIKLSDQPLLPPANLTDTQLTLYNQLRLQPQPATKLAEMLQLPISTINAALAVLELNAHITYRKGVWLIN